MLRSHSSNVLQVSVLNHKRRMLLEKTDHVLLQRCIPHIFPCGCRCYFTLAIRICVSAVGAVRFFGCG